MTNQLCKSSAVILCFFLLPIPGWTLGTNISFKSASMQGNTRMITYEYGNLGKRVLYDTDGQASLIALLGLMKQDYFDQKPSSEKENFENWKTYRAAVVTNLTRMKAFYEHNVCNYGVFFADLCPTIQYLMGKLDQDTVQFIDITHLSNFLRNMEGALDLKHRYQIDRYKPDGTKRDRQENLASHMFSTENLNVWLPDQESTARCKDGHSSENGFVAQLAQAGNSQPTENPTFIHRSDQ